MIPTESEKQHREYELGLARAALGSVSQEKEKSAREFSSLQWRDEARLASKRKRAEDQLGDKILEKKKKALEAVEIDDGSEAEESDAEPDPEQIAQKKDVLTPKQYISEETGNIFSSF